MKLRLKGNSIRIRLDRQDLMKLTEHGRIEDALVFGPSATFCYAVESGDAPLDKPTASYLDGRLTIQIAPEDVVTWATTDRVGFRHEQRIEGGVIRVLVEKDFACIDRPSGEEDDDAFAFPNPSATC